MEIVFTALLLSPKTMKIGFTLVSRYFAGAMATEISHDAPLKAITPHHFNLDRSLSLGPRYFLPEKKNNNARVGKNAKKTASLI